MNKGRRTWTGGGGGVLLCRRCELKINKEAAGAET